MHGRGVIKIIILIVLLIVICLVACTTRQSQSISQSPPLGNVSPIPSRMKLWGSAFSLNGSLTDCLQSWQTASSAAASVSRTNLDEGKSLVNTVSV